MALEDFFTLTEIKDGLATVSRVKEFMSFMQKDHLDIVRICDEARQWSTVASILSATQNKDCLDHFIQLNGVRFLSTWLTHSCDAPDGPVEETISLILEALQKLSLDRKEYRNKLISSGIVSAVKQVVNSIKKPHIQERARILLDKLESARDESVNKQDEEKHWLCCNDGLKDDSSMIEGSVQLPSPVPDASFKERDDEGSHGIQSAGNNSHNSNDKICSKFSKEDAIRDSGLPDHSVLHKSSSAVDADKIPENVQLFVSSLDPCLEDTSVTVVASSCTVENAGVTMHDSSFCVERNAVMQSDLSQMGTRLDHKEREVEMGKKDSGQCENSWQDAIVISSSLKDTAMVDNEHSRKAEAGSTKIREPQTSVAVDCGSSEHKEAFEELKAMGNDLSGVMPEETHSSFHGLDAQGVCTNTRKTRSSSLSARKSAHHKHQCGSSKSMKGASNGTEINQSKPLSLEYGDDALEVAVQVALEAKLEVADREQTSSSPKGNSEVDILDSSSSEREEIKGVRSNASKSPTRIDHSDNDSSPRGSSSRASDNSDVDSRNSGKPASPNPTSFQEFQQNLEKSKCIFDLNEDVCTEDIDYPYVPVRECQKNLSAPVAVIASSNGTSGLPGMPLHFEGELGWRGSAATSAFRPASPRRTRNCEKTNFGPKQNASFLKIDLNVAEDESGEAADLVLEKQMSVSSGLPSGESSLEVTSAKAERMKLDLNRLGEENAVPNTSSYWKLHSQNSNGSSSPASSSNSKQPSMRDIDLNDKPSFFEPCGPNTSNNFFLDRGDHGKFKLDDPDITIMGSRMVLERKDPVKQDLPFFANVSGMGSRTSEVRYGYNGLATGPPLSLPSTMYGPSSFPYMIDSRGVTVVPQILGSSGALNGSTCRPPFLVNISGSQSGLGVVGGLRPGLDLNTGTLSLDDGTKETSNFRQFFTQGHSGLREEQARAGSQPAAGSNVGLKRKEPDYAWGTYPFGCKQDSSALERGVLGGSPFRL